MSKIRTLLAYLLQLPPTPEPPHGDEGAIQIFKPSRRYLQLRTVRWVLVQLSSAFGLVVALNWRSIPGSMAFVEGVQLGPLTLGSFLGGWLFHLIEAWGVTFFLLQIPITLASIRLDYEMRWYLVTDRSLRIREGLKTVRERTMTFANVQNLTIRQNPIQRLFGISDLKVRSAGGGSSSEESGSDEEETSDKGLHLAVFRGIENAAEVRDLVLSHLKQLRSSGIGDPDDTESQLGPSLLPSPFVSEAAGRLQHEAVRLREAMSKL
ncbi:MAG: PH domain-containing protein [bacterium]|nr:PH domain-containing protein [bacterium]